MTKAKRSMALLLALLAFLIFCCGPLCDSAQAIAGVDDAIIAIIIAALAAMGITFTTTGVFNNLQDYVGSLMQEFATSSGLSVNQQLSGAQTGTNKLGQILLNNRFVLYVDTFARWLVLKLGLTNNDSEILESGNPSMNGVELLNFPITISSDSNSYTDYIFAQGDTGGIIYGVLVTTGSYWAIKCVSENPGTFYRYRIFSDGEIRTFTQDLAPNPYVQGQYYLDSAWIDDAGHYPALSTMSKISDTQWYNLIRSGENILEGLGYEIGVGTGVIDYPTDNSDFVPGDGAILDVGGEWGMTYDDVTDQVIPRDYEDSSIWYEGEVSVQEQVEDTPAQSVEQNPNEYQVAGLQSVFPFCIPFDIYSFFECLAADPVAPSFTWRFYVPGICDEELTVDLAVFDTVAQIVRTMELLAFIVGLALVTRDKFLRG